VIFSAFNSNLEPNLFGAWGIEVSIFEIAGHYIKVIEGYHVIQCLNTSWSSVQ
jgi:hypothetical protein